MKLAMYYIFFIISVILFLTADYKENTHDMIYWGFVFIFHVILIRAEEIEKLKAKTKG